MKIAIALLSAACLWGQGIKPRPSLSDYPAAGESGGLKIGAALLPPDEVRNRFSSELNGRYLVIEVAVYASEDHPADIDPMDFLLRAPGTRTATRPANPKSMAGVLQKGGARGRDRDITVHPSVGIGYETGPRGYDPVTGQRRGGGLSTSTGVGVGVGSSGRGPASTEADRRTMEMELGEQALPAGPASKPVAGYLFFPIPQGDKRGKYELEFDVKGDRITIPLPQPRR